MEQDNAMRYDVGTHFTDEKADNVDGFTLIAADEENQMYRVAEKVYRENRGENVWLDYWISNLSDTLYERVDTGKSTPTGVVSEEELAEIRDKVAAVRA